MLPGKKTDSEIVKIIALKNSHGNFDMTLGDYQIALKKLLYILVDIPQDEVVELDIIYSILE